MEGQPHSVFPKQVMGGEAYTKIPDKNAYKCFFGLSQKETAAPLTLRKNSRAKKRGLLRL